MSEEITVLPCPRCGVVGLHRCGEAPDSLARACEQRDEASREVVKLTLRLSEQNAAVVRLRSERDAIAQKAAADLQLQEALNVKAMQRAEQLAGQLARLTAECDALNAEAVRLSGLLETYQVVSADWEAEVERLRAVVREVADFDEAEAEAIGCDAGNPDGGNPRDCPHCQLMSRVRYLRAALDKEKQP